MSSYLTTSTAASTYALKTDGALKGNFTLDGTAASPNSDGSILIGSLSSGYNYLSLQAGVIQGVTYASGNKSFTLNGLEGLKLFSSGQGVRFPDATTQTTAYPGSSDFLLKADNLSGLANTGTARTNLGLGTMAVETASNYLTTATASSTYFTIASAANKADLASPALTGTPTAPTATTGTNTTQVATTAFVQQEVPDFATTSEIMSPSSTTKVLSPFDAVRMITNAAFFDTKAATGSFNTSGTGAEAYKVTNDRLLALGTPNAGIAGHGQNMFDTTASSWGLLAAKRGAFHYTQDWSKKIFASGTTMFNLIGDSATTTRVMIGGKAAFGTGSPTKQSIGWKLVGGGSNALVLVTYGYNGTSSVVTETTSSFTPVVNQAFDWFIYHEPNVSTPSLSKCYLYVNDNLVATGQNSPADATITFNYFLQGCESTGSHATRMAYYAFPTKIWWSRS
jgi:hypothetical protein